MKIGIEAQRIFRKKKGGMDVVATEIIKSLQKIDKDNEYIIYTSGNPEEDIAIGETDNFKIKSVRGISYVDWEQIWLPLQARKDNVSILHSTSNTAPLWGSYNKVVTVHDIMYLEKNNWMGNPNWYQRLGNYYRSLIVPFVINSAERVITVSDFEKHNILKRFPIHHDTIQVVSNGVSQEFKKIDDEYYLDQVKQKYKISDKYIFFLGNTEPRKNALNMIKAYALLCDRKKNTPLLVITNITSDFLNHLLEKANCQHLSSRIILTGYVDFKDLPALYSLAECYVYPSFREGFGLPIIEAMACETPVITSDTSSMPEIAGNAALLIDPSNPESIAEAMVKYLSIPSLRNENIMKGKQRCLQYTWDMSAKTLCDIYKSLT